MNYFVFLSFFLFAVSNLAYAQNNHVNQEKCGSTHINDRYLNNNSELKKTFLINQQEVNQLVQKKKRQRSEEEVYVVPIVIHVMHNGEEIGEGDNISDSQIHSGIQQINDAFRNVEGLSVDTKIEFKLAVVDPNCQPTTGINRVNVATVYPQYTSYGVDFRNENLGVSDQALKELISWSNMNYYNIWLVNRIDSLLFSGVAGYAYYPSGRYSMVDGTIMKNVYFGNHGSARSTNKTQVGIHELGHALFLHHTFEGDANGTVCPEVSGCGIGSGDCCDDTAPHKRILMCTNGQDNECTELPFDSNTANNFMNYTSCDYLFTNDQKYRMRATLETLRASLLTSPVFDTSYYDNQSQILGSCIPVTSDIGLSAGYAGIMNVAISDVFSHSSSNSRNDGGYLDVTNDCLTQIRLEEDKEYELDVTVWLNTNFVKAWIDYNNNGSFESNELIFDEILDANTSHSTNFTVPIGGVTGEYLRMRVMNDLSDFSNACYDPVYGQAEDYTVIVSRDVLTQTNLSNVTNVELYPNPFEYDFLVETPAKMEYSLTNVDNRLVAKGICDGKCNLGQTLPSGVYILCLKHHQKNHYYKVVKI